MLVIVEKKVSPVDVRYLLASFLHYPPKTIKRFILKQGIICPCKHRLLIVRPYKCKLCRVPIALWSTSISLSWFVERNKFDLGP